MIVERHGRRLGLYLADSHGPDPAGVSVRERAFLRACARAFRAHVRFDRACTRAFESARAPMCACMLARARVLCVSVLVCCVLCVCCVVCGRVGLRECVLW